jgi:hypothetical protein
MTNSKQNKINFLKQAIEVTRVDIRNMSLNNVSKTSDKYVKASEFQVECARKLLQLSK